MKKIIFLLLFVQIFAFGQGSGKKPLSFPPITQSVLGKVLSNDGTNYVWITGATPTSNITDWATAWDARLALKTTSNIAEGTNLYWTNARGDARYTQLNPAIVAGTFTKITYDSKGLVVSGTNILSSDISDLSTFFDTRLALKTTTNLPEGANLYFTPARVAASPITGFVSGAGVVSPTDNVLQAIQKLDGNKVFSKTQSASANYTLTASDEFIGVVTSGITLNLPDPSINEGRKVSVIMKVEGSVNFNYPIYRTRSGSGVINTTVISTDASAGAGWSWNSVDLVVMGGQYWLY